MSRKLELIQQIIQLEENLKPLKAELELVAKKEAENINNRVNLCYILKDKFELSELVFSSFTKCTCGAGLAYPTNIGIHGAWHCSKILLADYFPTELHRGPLPFSMYEIKSEDQPSAKGRTTRPNTKEETI